jgi:hypothetical protein
MIDLVKKALAAQYEATLWMYGDCLDKCTPELWDAKVARWPFWNVAYHTLCFADLYMSPREEAWVPREIHPKGMEELREEYPSRKFERVELLEYLGYCRAKALDSVGTETAETLAGPSGFAWYKVNRLEMHFVNIRHIQHHTGQLSALLRRSAIEPKWCGSGWKS